MPMKFVEPIIEILKKAAEEDGTCRLQAKEMVENLSRDQRSTMAAWVYDLSAIVHKVRVEKDSMSR